MVRCNKIQGKPCRCELSEPRIKRLLQTITRNTLKTLLGNVTRAERDELRTAAQVPNAKAYIQLYLEELSNHRECLNELILEM